MSVQIETVLGTVTIQTFLAGHGMATVSSEWEGGRLIREVQRPVSDVYGLEIRLAPDASNRGGRVLWSGTAETALGARPQLPQEATIFLNALRDAKPRRSYRRRTPPPASGSSGGRKLGK